MIIYNVTVNVAEDIAGEWLSWMKDVHVPEVMATGCFLENKIMKLLVEEETGGISFAVQYSCNSMDDYDRYIENYATEMRAKTQARYQDRLVAFRTLLEVM